MLSSIEPCKTQIVTNKTSYLWREVRVHKIGILFNYEVRYVRDVAWKGGEAGDGERDGKAGGYLDRAGEFSNSLFRAGVIS